MAIEPLAVERMFLKCRQSLTAKDDCNIDRDQELLKKRWFFGGTPKKKFSNVSLPYDQSANEEVRAMNLIYIVYPSGRITAHLKESQFNK